MHNLKVISKRGTLTQISIIIFSLLAAVGVVFLIIYNVAQETTGEVDYSINLGIIQESVKITDDNQVSLDIARGEDEVELEELKLILFDGENLEEVILDASGLKNARSKSFSFNLKNLLKLTKISLIPVIKVKSKKISLKVSDSVTLDYDTDSGDVSVSQEENVCGNKIVDLGEGCDDGNLISKDGCSIFCVKETCAIQSGILCTGDKICGGTKLTASDPGICCDQVCVNKVVCGDKSVGKGEVCDDGTNNGKYGYCNDDCSAQGSRCGDGTCDSANEDYTSCAGDCPLCTEGQTKQCGSTDVGVCSYGTQTCGISNLWGDCSGNVEASSEVCDGTDKDCDGLIDDSLSAPSSDNQNGVCSGQVKLCSGALGWTEPNYALISNYESAETTLCTDNLDNDCDGYTDAVDSGCPEPAECTSGVCCDLALQEFKSAGTSCGGTTDCDYLDNTCRDYDDVPATCSGSSASCGSGACNSYINAATGTSCGDSSYCYLGNCKIPTNSYVTQKTSGFYVGGEIGSIEDANSICASEFGSGWVVAYQSDQFPSPLPTDCPGGSAWLMAGDLMQSFRHCDWWSDVGAEGYATPGENDCNRDHGYEDCTLSKKILCYNLYT